jgi:hypothetical protein
MFSFHVSSVFRQIIVLIVIVILILYSSSLSLSSLAHQLELSFGLR